MVQMKRNEITQTEDVQPSEICYHQIFDGVLGKVIPWSAKNN